jgi:fibronectin-binding autotransporter adhesin
VTLQSGSVLAIEMNGAACDKLVSTGTINVNGATLNVTALGTLAVGSYVIASSDFPIGGTFAGLTDGATFTMGNITFVISYGGNKITLTVADDTSGTVYKIR